MTGKNNLTVSKITLVVMGIGTIPVFATFGIFIVPTLIVWAVCLGLLFLCEWLIGKMKKRFSSNLGAFTATAIMCITLIVWLIIESNAHTGGKFDFNALEQQLYLIMFLPPMIVSLIVNIGNIIYKVRIEKNDPADEIINKSE